MTRFPHFRAWIFFHSHVKCAPKEVHTLSNIQLAAAAIADSNTAGVPIEQMAIFAGVVRGAHFASEPAKLPIIKVALVNDDGYTIDA